MNKKTFIKNFLIVAVVAVFLFISNKVLLADDPMKAPQIGPPGPTCSGGSCSGNSGSGCSWANMPPSPLPPSVPPSTLNAEGRPVLTDNLQNATSGNAWATAFLAPYEGLSAKGASLTQAGTGPYGLGTVADMAISAIQQGDAARTAGDTVMANMYYAQAQAYDALIFQPAEKAMEDGLPGFYWQVSDRPTFTPASGAANVVNYLVAPVDAFTIPSADFSGARLAAAVQSFTNPAPGTGAPNTIGNIQLAQFVSGLVAKDPGILTTKTGINMSYDESYEFIFGAYNANRVGYYNSQWAHNNQGDLITVMKANQAVWGKPDGNVSNYGEFYNPLNHWGTQVQTNNTTYVYSQGGEWVNRGTGRIADSKELYDIYAAMWSKDHVTASSPSGGGSNTGGSGSTGSGSGSSGPVGFGNVSLSDTVGHTSHFGDVAFSTSGGTNPTTDLSNVSIQVFFEATGVQAGNSGSHGGDGVGGVVATGGQVEAALEAAYGFSMESYGPASQSW